MRERKLVLPEEELGINTDGRLIHRFAISQPLRELSIVVQLNDDDPEVDAACESVLNNPAHILGQLDVKMSSETCGFNHMPTFDLDVNRKMRELRVNLKYPQMSSVSQVKLCLAHYFRNQPVVEGVFLEYRDEY